MTKSALVEKVAADLKRALDADRDGLTVQVLDQWEAVVASLKEAAEILGRDRTGAEDTRAHDLVREAERVLRDELGQMALPFQPQTLRYAALDAHKLLYRQVLS